jgi:hypothetical protein
VTPIWSLSELEAADTMVTKATMMAKLMRIARDMAFFFGPTEQKNEQKK